MFLQCLNDFSKMLYALVFHKHNKLSQNYRALQCNYSASPLHSECSGYSPCPLIFKVRNANWRTEQLPAGLCPGGVNTGRVR